MDLATDTSLMVDISDALSEQDKVKFTVHTKVGYAKLCQYDTRNTLSHLQTTLKAFKKADFTTVREHEEFVWLHDRFVENEDYAGIIVSCFFFKAGTSTHVKISSYCMILKIPPAPPKPNFDEPRQKLAKLREGR